jgi:hypothetical protein
MDTRAPPSNAARKALSDEWNREAAFIGMGGSIPIAGYFKSILGMDAMLIGFGPRTTRSTAERKVRRGELPQGHAQLGPHAGRAHLTPRRARPRGRLRDQSGDTAPARQLHTAPARLFPRGCRDRVSGGWRG